ncbi:MAG: hypothetical protein ACFFDN_44705, partial [Candidatus Hodarchaeota archaeon]
MFPIWFLIILVLRLNYGLQSASLDEGSYLTVSSLLLKGRKLYVDIPAAKPPLFYILNSIIAFFAGGDLIIARIMCAMITAIISCIITEIVFMLYKNKSYLLSGLFFSIVAGLPSFENYFVLTETYVVLIECLVIFTIIKSIISKMHKNLYFISSGFLIAFSLAIRQTAIIFFIWMLFLLGLLKRKKYVKSQNLLHVFLGFILSSILILTYIFLFSNIQKAIYWNIFEPLEYITSTANARSILRLSWFSIIFQTILPLLLISALVLDIDFKVYKKS